MGYARSFVCKFSRKGRIKTNVARRMAKKWSSKQIVLSEYRLTLSNGEKKNYIYSIPNVKFHKKKLNEISLVGVMKEC